MHRTSGAGSGEPAGERADGFSSASSSISGSDSDVEISSNGICFDGAESGGVIVLAAASSSIDLDISSRHLARDRARKRERRPIKMDARVRGSLCAVQLRSRRSC